ncbi:CHAT domain-containing protein [Coleofasciculus sp. F4-SAH-05]|uniref:CHAT domain-containing protein n=1 Tax=Coleofasciculus sp. F4-SAH-05 TaxID=3069525 RepID=UPI0032F963F3
MKNKWYLSVRNKCFSAVRSKRFSANQWDISWLLLAILTAILCIVISPVSATGIGQPEPQPAAIETTTVNPSPEAWVKQGRTFYEAGQYTDAVELLEKAAQAYQTQGETIKQATVLSNLSLAYQQLGLWSQANDAISQSLTLLQTEPNGDVSTHHLNVLAQSIEIQGRLQLNQGQPEPALATWEQATALYNQLGDKTGKIKSQINQAQAMQALGFHRRALTLLQQVRQTLDNQPDSLTKAVGLRSLGEVLQFVNDLPQARQVLDESLQIARQLESPSDISAALFSLANTTRQQQQVEAALDFYQQAITAAPSPLLQLRAKLNQLSLLIETGNHQQAQSLVPQIQNQLNTLPLSDQGISYRINFAESLIKLATSVETRHGASLHPDIAQILTTAIQQAETLGDKRLQAYALGTLGHLYEQTNQLQQAKDLTQQALIKTQAIEAWDSLYPWQWQLGRLLKQQGDTQGAIVAYQGAVDTLQSLRSDLVAVNSNVQYSFRKQVEPIYRELVELLLPADNTQISPEQLEQARQVVESLQIAELDNFFQADCITAKPVNIDTIDKEAAVLYPIILSDRLEVIVHLPNQPLRRYTTFVAQTELESTLEKLRQALPQRTSLRFLPLARKVYDWIIKPAAEDLAQSEAKTLVFVLNGTLRNIPMAALHDGEQFLLQNYAIALTPGLELFESKPLTEQKLEVLTAGLSESRLDFSALPNVKIELQQIQSFMPGKLLLNQEFTKSTLENTMGNVSFPVVHLATHGQFSSEAEGTFIITWDDKLNVNELSSLLKTTDLRRTNPIELLVLSACETAKGDDQAALGLAGVAVRAGARSTIATLWLVDDATTADLMVKFYHVLTEDKVNKAEALRRAQLLILQDPKYRKHPYFWTPFVLVGNWI